MAQTESEPGLGFLPFDPFDVEFRRDPYPVYKRMRETEPIRQSPLGIWAFFRYRDALEILHHPRASSDQNNSELAQMFLDQMPEEYQGMAEGRAQSFLFMDPPDHTRLRGLVSKAFTPRYVDGLRPRMQQVTDELLDRVQSRGEMDVVEDLAYPLPVTVISEMLGVPPEDNEIFKSWSRELAKSLDPEIMTPPEVVKRRQQTVEEFSDYFRERIAERKKRPMQDLLSGLVAAEEQGETLTEEELLATCILLLVAGHETTVNLIANGVLALLRNPGEFEKLRANPGLTKSAVEEVLRYDAPVQLTGRTMLEDFEVDGHTLKKGQTVILLLASANRDPDQFPDPDSFDIERKPNQHIAFSQGIHFCLGAYLARAEGQISLTAIAARLPKIKLAIETPDYKENLVLRGMESLPVTF